MSDVRTISCLGSGEDEPESTMYKAMKRVGRLLAKQGVKIATGAFGGPGMKAPLEGAQEQDAESARIGFTFLGLTVNPHVNHTVDCEEIAKTVTFPGMKIPFIGFAFRLIGLLSSDGFIIGAGGGIGTFLELVALILFNTKMWKRSNTQKRVAILFPPEIKSIITGWDEKMLQQLYDWGLLSDEVRTLIKVVKTPEEAVEWVLG
ncbi:MAG: hypothetical protein PHR36_01850 [Patescibacteria group bacterium]|nr:hypothetical protein [Patescibacteria group bacterium]